MRRAKIVAIILGTAAIISLGFMLFAFVQKIAADRATLLAEERRRQEEIQRHRADSTADVADEQRQLAVENEERALENEAEAIQQRNIANDARAEAVENAQEAETQRTRAEAEADSARRARDRADENARIATMEREEALRLRMLSIGKSMSIKSLQVQGQQDLQTLLAYQAYLFNKNNKGLENDADIYTGLYNVAKQYGNVNYKVFRGHNGGIKSIAYVPGKNEFYTSGYDGQVLKWNTDGTDQTYQVIYTDAAIVEVLAISPDASWLACGSGSSSIRMIPLSGNNTEYELEGHTGKIKSLVFSYDGDYLYSASLDGKVLKWDLAARTSQDVTTGEMKITSIDISSNGNYLAGINSQGNVIVWDPENNTENFRIETTARNIKVIRFKPDENILAIGDVNGNLELWDVATRRKISDVKAHDAQINDIRFNPTLNQMATASNDKSIKIFNNIDDLTESPITLSDNEGFVLVIQFSSNGELIVSGTYEDTQNLVGRPSHVQYMVEDICDRVTRNMTQDEWNTYVARDIPLEQTCPQKDYNIKVNVVR